jgi:transmembrane sensor
VTDHANITALEEEGLVWVERAMSSAVTQADLDALTLWRNQSEEHASALREVIGFQRACLALAVERPVEAVVRQSMRKPRLARRALLGASMAVFAGAAAWAAVDPPLRLWPSIAEISADYRTEKGQQRQVVLGEGVRVHMNTLTSLSEVQVAGKTGLRLIEGEIAVTLPSTAEPYAFLVKDLVITARSGTINVRSDGTGISITQIDGKADVTFGDKAISLAPQQMVRFIDGVLKMRKSVDLSPIVAWRRDILLLRNSSVAAAVQEINRYRPGVIVVGSAQLAARRINVVLQLDDIPGSLDAICRLTGAHATAVGNYVVLS